MAGSRPGSNSTSTTGPMTCTIFPWLMLPVPFFARLGRRGPSPATSSGSPCPLLERLGAAHDIEQLLRDLLLTGFVVLDGQHADHVLGVLGGGFHGRHPRAVLAGQRLHEGLE